MRNMFKKIIASTVASAMCVIGSIGSLNASAYTPKCNWNIFAANNPNVPGQVWRNTYSLPAYGGGYKICCTSFHGSNDSYIEVTSNFGFSCNITSTDYFDVNGSSVGGTAQFTFTVHTSEYLTASGTIGYNL